MYGLDEKPSRVKLVSYQFIEGIKSQVNVIEEFIISPEGNYSKIIASSSNNKKETKISVYHSKTNQITAQVALILDEEIRSNTVEIYFVEENILYNISFEIDSKNLKTVMPVVKQIIDGFVNLI